MCVSSRVGFFEGQGRISSSTRYMVNMPGLGGHGFSNFSGSENDSCRYCESFADAAVIVSVLRRIPKLRRTRQQGSGPSKNTANVISSKTFKKISLVKKYSDIFKNLSIDLTI